jgi:hypothetical protein
MHVVIWHYAFCVWGSSGKFCRHAHQPVLYHALAESQQPPDAPAGSFQSMLCKRQQHGSCASFYYPMLMCADVVWCTEPMLCKRQQQC